MLLWQSDEELNLKINININFVLKFAYQMVVWKGTTQISSDLSRLRKVYFHLSCIRFSPHRKNETEANTFKKFLWEKYFAKWVKMNDTNRQGSLARTATALISPHFPEAETGIIVLQSLTPYLSILSHTLHILPWFPYPTHTIKTSHTPGNYFPNRKIFIRGFTFS